MPCVTTIETTLMRKGVEQDSSEFETGGYPYRYKIQSGTPSNRRGSSEPYNSKQQEYRLLGHYGKDDVFVQFVRDGKDIHTATASLLFNTPYEDVTKAQRKKGKTLNFGQ